MKKRTLGSRFKKYGEADGEIPKGFIRCTHCHMLVDILRRDPGGHPIVGCDLGRAETFGFRDGSRLAGRLS